jgi:hypothetical protein
MAVCITGELRYWKSAVDIYSLGYRSILQDSDIFVIKPAHEDWTRFSQVYPSTQFFSQSSCNVTSASLKRYYCESTFRRHCRLNFVQTLCDAEQCLRHIDRMESRRGRHYNFVARLRPDTFPETVLKLSRMPNDNEVFVTPDDGWIGWGRGINDKFVVGGRNAMRAYLNRIDDLDRISFHHTYVSETFLRAVLKRHQVHTTYLHHFGFCTITYRAIMLAKKRPSACVNRWNSPSEHKRKCPFLKCKAECTCSQLACSECLETSEQLFLNFTDSFRVT